MFELNDRFVSLLLIKNHDNYGMMSDVTGFTWEVHEKWVVPGIWLVAGMTCKRIGVR